MSRSTLETWSWVLIYGGLMVGCLGLFMVRGGGSVGWALMVAGAAAVVGGLVMIVLRSRMPPGD